jgi:hypothetical protein
MTSVMPTDAAKLIGDQLMAVVTTSSGKKGVGLIAAMAVALYGARNGASAVITGLDIAYEEKETRSFVRLTLMSLAITAFGVFVAIVALIAIAALGHLGDLLSGAPWIFVIAGKLVSYVALLLAGAAGAATLYSYGPDRVKARWVWITPGSRVAATLWLLLHPRVRDLRRRFRQLQCHLWLARCGHRVSDLALSFELCPTVRRRTQRRDRASDAVRHHRRAGDATRAAWRCRRRECRHGRGGCLAFVSRTRRRSYCQGRPAIRQPRVARDAARRTGAFSQNTRNPRYCRTIRAPSGRPGATRRGADGCGRPARMA